MGKYSFLEYTFVFDPSETWSHLGQFESNLAKYLDSVGLEAEVLQAIGNSDKRILVVSKKSEPKLPEPKKAKKLDLTKSFKNMVKKHV